jgi:hypothetical protein
MGIFMTSISQNIAQKLDIVANATRNRAVDALHHCEIPPGESRAFGLSAARVGRSLA